MGAYLLFFITGLVFSMVGLGGGSVFVPFFTFLEYDLKTIAVPAGVFLVWVTAFSSSINYVRHKQVHYRLAFIFLLGSFLSVVLGQWFLFQKTSSTTLMLILGITVVLSASRFLFFSETFGVIYLKNKIIETFIFFIGGLGVGLVSVLTGIGGGFLMVPFMLHFGVEIKKAAGTSAFVIFFTSAFAFLTHAFTHFNLQFLKDELWIYGLAVFIGGILGSKIQVVKLKNKHVKNLMGIVLFFLGVYVFYKFFQGEV